MVSMGCKRRMTVLAVTRVIIALTLALIVSPRTAAAQEAEAALEQNPFRDAFYEQRRCPDDPALQPAACQNGSDPSAWVTLGQQTICDAPPARNMRWFGSSRERSAGSAERECEYHRSTWKAGVCEVGETFCAKCEPARSTADRAIDLLLEAGLRPASRELMRMARGLLMNPVASRVASLTARVRSTMDLVDSVHSRAYHSLELEQARALVDEAVRDIVDGQALLEATVLAQPNGTGLRDELHRNAGTGQGSPALIPPPPMALIPSAPRRLRATLQPCRITRGEQRCSKLASAVEVVVPGLRTGDHVVCLRAGRAKVCLCVCARVRACV